MKNARNNGQKRVKNCLKWTASGLLLALMFVLVFAGTLSGAFGIENELQQNGIIQSNVASAAGVWYGNTANAEDQFSVISLEDTFRNTESKTIRINPNVDKRGGMWTTNVNQLKVNTWETDGDQGGKWYIGKNDSHTGKDFACAWFVYDLGENYKNRIYGNISISFTAKYTMWDAGGMIAIESGDNLVELPQSTSDGDSSWYDKVKNGFQNTGASCTKTAELVPDTNWIGAYKKTTHDIDLTHNVTGRYVRLHFATYDRDAYNEHQLNNVSVTLTRTLAYNRVYDKNGMKSDSVVDAENNLEFMANSTLTSSFYVGKDQYFTNWNTRADGSGVAMAIGASTGTSTAANTFGGVVKSNLQNGQTSTTLYAQYKEIPFEFNGVPYNTYNPQETNLVVLEGKLNYMSSTIDGYDTSIEYKNAAGVTIPQPDKKGKYTATITVKKGGVVRGTRTVEFEVVEGDFGKIQGGTGKWGSATNPYVISNETHLKNLSAIVNGRDALNSIVGSNNNLVTAEDVVATDKTYKDCYFVVAADLGTADAQIALVPIGKDNTHYFAGTIFGGNDSDANNRTMRTISLNIQSGDVSNVGLFGYVKGATATISHLTTAGTIVGGAAVGGLVGYADGVTISNCRNNATVKALGSAATFGGKQGAYLGGFVGYATASVTIKNCYNGGEITTVTSWPHSNIVGGIVGHLGTGGEVSYCYNKGKVVGLDNIGGIVGINNGTVSYCYQDGELNDLSVGTEPSNFITSNGGTITNCWILPGASRTGYNQDTTPNGKKLELIDINNNKNVKMYAPAVVDGTTYTVPTGKWESIVEKDINGFEVFAADANGNKLLLKKGEYLRSAKAIDWATTATPTIIDSNATANSNGQTIQNSMPIDIVYVYSATVDYDVFVSHSKIGKSVSNTTYNGKEQTIGEIQNLPQNTVASVFYFENGNAASTATSAKKDWREGGYVVVVDIKIGDKVVGRDVFDWTINKKTLTVEYQWTPGLYNNVSVVYNGEQQGLLSFEIKGFVANESVASGNATVALTYTNTDYTLAGNKYTLKKDKSTNVGQYGVSFTLEANNYALDTNATHAFSWTISLKSITIGQSSFYYGTNIEQKLTDGTVFQNLVSEHSVRVDTQKHNFYKQNIGNNQYTILQSDITVNDNSGQPVTGNYNITGGVIITVLAGDFWSDGTTDIANKPWGSPNNPYVIGTKDQLTRLAQIVGGTSAVNSIKNDTYVYVQAQSGDYSNAYFKLANDIGGVGNITPIGVNTHPFKGNFDGNHNTIGGLNINRAGDYVGLFGCISGATIKNLTVNGSVKGSQYVGGVVGYALNSTIENVTNNASVSSTTDKYVDYSIVRYHAHIPNSGEGVDKIKDRNQDTKYCTSSYGAMSFVIEVPNGTFLTGFTIQNADDTNNNQKRTPKEVYIWGSNVKPTLGNNTSETPYGKSPSDSGQQGWVSIYENKDIGLPSTNSTKQAYAFNQEYNYKYYWIRVVGKNKQIQFAEFEVLTQGGSVGGVVGYAKNTSIEGATNTATVNAGSNVGGIVGEFNSLGKSVSGATNSGAITSSNTAAGIVGKLTEGSISGSKNTGRVTASVATSIGGETGAFLGGIAGWANGNVNKCYNEGEITTETSWGNSNIVGGIVGFLVNGKTVSYCYNSGTIAGSSQIGGIIGKLPGYRSTVTYCYHSGTINSVWNDANGVAQGELGHITGNNTEVLDSCWILPGASTNTAASTKIKTNGRKLEVGQNKYVPATIADYAEHSWLDILTVEINGFRVQESVGKNQFFCSDNGSDTNTKYVKPSKTEGFAGDNGDVTVWYSATIASNIRVRVQNIDIDNKSSIYDNTEHTFDFTSKPSQSANSANVYAVQFAYLGRNYGKFVPKDVDVYDTTITVKIGDQVVGVKTGVTYTIEKATLNVGWEWTDNSHKNRYDRRENVDKVQFVYNGKEQGLMSVSLGNTALFDVTGDKLTNTDAATYTRTYTLNDTRNYKLNFTNNDTGLTESATSVEFKWTIRKNKLTVFNRWVAEDFGKDSNLYTFEYNTTHRGLLTTNDAITFFTEKATDNTKPELKQGTDYTISEHQNAISVGEYSRIVTILNNNYEVDKTHAYVGSSTTATVDKGIKVSENKLVVTYTWKIVPYSLATNIISGNVWFGGTTNLIVGNQGIANVEGYTTKSYYPLQADKKGAPGVQQVLVYAQHNYAASSFVLYVKYNNGNVVPLTRDTEYTVGTLDTSTNTFGTFNVNVVSQANPVEDTNVTARGMGNFSGDITKYYTAMFSDFGGNVTSENWGSAGNPYVISTPEHLLRLSQIVNGGKAWNSIQNTVTEGLCVAPKGTAVATDRAYRGAYFLVAADIDNIDMTGNVSTDGVYNFLPIGHRNEQSQTDMPFSGTFDGNGKKIKFVYNVNRNNFYNNSEAHSDYVGLFGYIAGYKVGAEQKYATIKNLSIESMDGNEVDDNGGIIGKDYVGGIAGYAVDSKLYNVSMMYGSWVRGENYVGGIVGYADNTWLEVEKDYGNAITYTNVGGIQYVGGIVGKWIVRSEEQIGGGKDKQEYITTTLGTDVNGTQYVGGLVGWLDTSACTDSVVFAPIVKGSGQNKNVVKGTEYVGALFGVVVGNGYHQSATQGKYTAIVISDQKVNNITLQTNTSAKVVGGLVGYAESVGILFETDWNTSSTIFTLDDSTSFFGGVVGVLGKNSTIEAIIVTKEGDGSYLTGSEHTILNNTALGASGKPIGSFVGGIVGYVSSQAGTYWEANTTIFGNGISLVNSGQIHATGYAGGIFGALGDISTSVAQTFENDTNSILYNVLTTGVRSGNANTTLGIAPTVDSAYFTGAKGKLVNSASLSVTDGYVGGIAGYSGAKVRFVLRNTPQTGAIATANLNVYSGGNDIYINGSYAGGIAGYLVDNLEHELQYIVVRAKFNSETANSNATRVGGLVGYMGSGKVENCVVTNGGNSNVNELTDTFKGSEYVGGLVGETQNAIIRNSVSTGFNLDKTTNTKGGILGYGTNPTIEASWTFYIAKKRTNFAKNATPNGAYYATVSQSPYGKYILVDEGLINATESSYPTFENLCAFAGIATSQDATKGVLEFAVKVPNANLNASYTNTQLAFYNASGSDVETSNKDSFKGFENNNDVLTIKLGMETGTSMQVCVVSVRFVNVPKCSATSTEQDKIDIVEAAYVKPSNSTRYHVKATTADFDTTGTNPTYQVTHIVANVYFDYNGDMVYIGTAESSEKTGSYDSGTLTPGSETNPYTISTRQEWEDFAASVNNGSFKRGSYVKLLNDITISTLAGNSSNSFSGTFDGNGHTINLGTRGDNTDGTSLFPYAYSAVFRNLSIDGTITNTSREGLAGFVGIAKGKLEFYNCTNNVKVTAFRNAAGFTGFVYTYDIILTSCVNNGDIETKEGADNSEDSYSPIYYTYGTGGIIACIAISGNSARSFTIKSCINNGNITAPVNVGGIVGKISGNHSGDTISARCDLYMYDCANTGEIYSNQKLTDSQAGAFWDFTGDNKYYGRTVWCNAGGLVGIVFKSAAVHIYSSYNRGYIHGIGNVVGGLVGSIGDHNGKTYRTPNSRAMYPSEIYYCFNTGRVEVGYDGVNTSNGINLWGTSGDKYCSAVVGGLVGVMSYGTIAYSYNTGTVACWGGVGVKGAYNSRAGGIIGESTANAQVSWTRNVTVKNCYNVGQINVYTKEDARYASGIVGYMDVDNAVNNTHVSNCYSVTNAVYYKQTNTYIDELIFGGDEKWTISGTLSDLSGLTAKMNDKGVLTTTFAEGSGNDASIESLTDDTKYINGTAKGYIYIYGCLPQLAVFALDTHDALSMRSVGFGQDQYGEFNNEAPQNTGSETYPYIIRDGIGLLGVQALVDLGYDFDNEYIEFANSTNNIKADGSTSSNSPLVCTSINMPKTDEQNTYLSATAGYYMSSSNGVTYNQAGKSYHLFALGAVCRSTPGKSGENSNDSFNWWIGNNHYYNGAYGNKEGVYKNYGTFKTQNILTIGRNGKVFKGSISGKQENNANTVINNLRITSGQTTGGAYGGLFGHVENAYIGYIEVGGESNIWAYSSDNQQIAATGAIAGYVTGDSIIEHCAVSGTTAIGAYGKKDDTHIASDITYAGGIVGLVNPKKGTQYEAGISTIIKECIVNISTTTGDRAAFAGIIQACKSNIGGVLGYVGGDAGASGKGNSVRIERCEVQKAAIQAANSAKTSSHIGGVLGYGSDYVAAFITGCKVGNGADTVTIKGEHSIGGIAGGMSNAKGGYIDSCTVGEKTTIERIDQGGGNISENPKHGTAIGGLVGFTEDSTDTTSPLTTTFSGTSAFNGKINVTVGTTNPGEHGDKKPVGNVGGIVGDMGSGANFASGSEVEVRGNINVTLEAANVGGVAGRTSNATFIGKFDVSPTMNTSAAENVGGFIGKNVGTVYILADTTERIVDGKLNGTEITIGGKIQGTSEVGGFIGVNNSGSSLNIGSNVANAKPYRSGTLSITIAEGAEISGSGNHVGGIVGKNEGAVDAAQNDYATIDIVKGTIVQNGTISGKNYVGGIIGLNQGLLTTGGGEADEIIGGIALSDDQIGDIKNLSITNKGSVKGGTPQNAQSDDDGQCVGGVIAWLDAPQTLRPEHMGKGDIAGAFENRGSVEGNRFVGGSLGYVGKYVKIATKGSVNTLFVNTGNVTAHSTFVGGSIGAIVGQITGAKVGTTVNFENTGTVNGLGYVGGSIGVLAGPAAYAQFVNSSKKDFTIDACNSVGGSVGYIGMPDALKTILNTYFNDNTYSNGDITVKNVHFEASGNLTANPSDATLAAAKDDGKGGVVDDNDWGGVGGAIGVLGRNQLATWENNTYYANGNVIAQNVNNVGGIVGLINANDITIGNLLAYNITVTGAKNVGGIVGATNGTNTKILSAYTIEGTFSGTENVGGIIGLANSTEGTATDAKTSYWVKGYSNAVLAGADVKDLQQTLGKFETIVEQVTVEGKQQSIVFTEDFCKLYTPKTYYVDYPGTHTYNGKTVTPGENVEQLTWDDYFKTRLGETSAQIKNGAWVKTVANAVTFTTGTEKTGWYFAFANDATGAYGLGTINTNHHKDGGDYELKYWKRIANAYTAQERADKEDKKTLDPPSDIVSGGQPQHATLYATATAAGEDSGYYLYMATSGASRPTATYSTDKFFIQVLTTTTTQAELAQNVAIYYRTISKGKTLTYNGYLRYAPVGITVDDGKTVPYVQTPQQDATKKDSYCYSADTTTGGTATGGAQIDPGNYESAVKIYYYDKDGKPYIVGGVSIKWEIKARQLSADIKSDPHRVYGDNRNQDDGHDMKVVISNIAPGAGTPPQFVITVTDKSSNPNVVTTFEYNGNTLSETGNGITLTATSVGNSSNNEWEASDNLYNVNEPTDITTKDVLFYIDFTNAKTYEVSVAMKQGDWTKRYTLDAKKDFSVNPAPLELTRSNPASEKYDGTAKSATWFISGFKYQDGAKEFAAFQPQFKTALGKTTDPKVEAYYNLYKGTATSGYTLETNITLGRPGETVSYGEKVENQSKTISYTLSGATQAGDYSIVFPSTGSSITVGNYTLKFYEGASPQTKPPVFSIAENKITISISYVDSTKQHPYNGQKKGKITITFEADNEIAGYGDYISNFFKASINNGGKEISKPSGTTSGKTAQWVFETGVDVKDYKVTISDGVNHTEYVKNCAHDAYPNNIIYKIKKAPLIVDFEPSGSTTYEYNTYHQGLSAVKLSGLYQNIDNGNKYDSVAITIIFNNNSYNVTINKNNSAVDVTNYINTRNVGNYTATIANSVGGAKGSNYYIDNTSVSTNWTITPHVLKLDGLEQDGTKIYDGAAVTPKLTVGGNNVTNGKTTYNDDTIQIKYSATLNGAAAKGIVNAGIYNISIGGSSAENAIKATRDGEDTTRNYTISGTDSATYTISKRPITVTWNMSTLKFVYDLTPHGLTVSGITGGGVGATLQFSSLDTAIVKTGYGNDVIKFTLQGKKVDAGKNYVMSIANSALNGIIVNDEVESTIDNYVISGTTCEKKFEIEKSQIIIKYAGGTTTKVYDAGFGISGKPFVFNTQSQNGGAHGTSELFDISYVYKDKNVGNDKEVVFTYVLKQNANYEYVGTGTESQDKGQITPAHIKVALDKLRSGKATRTFTNEPYYGGKDGASGNGKSTVYRSGEGFRVSGVFSSDDIKVVAKYAEAGDDRAMFDKYVNDIVKIDEKTFAKAAAGTHLKMLVFTMTGDDAKNYTFNVYNKLGTDGKKYSEKDSTAGDKQTVTVYDTDDKANEHQNASGADTIQIEITVKTYKVEYTNTAQSYANADNTYNTNWERVGVSNNPPGVTVTVSNGWMYADGQDHGDDEQAEKKVYKAYTTIRGSQNSVLLGAKISGIDGMELNYKMVNQPILTIGYFVVDNNDVFEIGSASSLMIASYYWWVAQNGQNPDFNLPLVATSTWHKIVSNDDYMTKPFEKPSDAPNDVDMTGWDWDMYFAWFEQQNDVKIFLNETGISNEDGTWGYYTTGEESQQTQYKKYRMVRDFSGKLSESDIAILEAFFPKEKGWGVGKTYLDNFLNTSVGSVLTAVGSVFRWYNGSVGQFEFDGNGYVIEYLNIMGYGKENVGLFDIIGANGIVKNLHLRNITINANQGNVGGIAGSIAATEGDADATKNVTNVSFHGKITASGGTVGGLFGTSARAIDGAIVLGEISATGASAGGVVGTATADLTKVVSMMQITASGGTVGAFTSNNAHVGEDCTHMTNAVWKSGTGFVNVDGKNVGYNDLMSGSNSLYANAASDSGTYDVISETFADSGQNVNPRQSKRLRDMVSVYLLMYSLSANGDKYTISESSWLVGTADGTNANPIVIANKQNVSLLRELRFAAFVLKANVSIDIASTFSGAFYGSVISAVNESGVSYDYKITCNKQMFEAYATTPTAWLVTPTQP